MTTAKAEEESKERQKSTKKMKKKVIEDEEESDVELSDEGEFFLRDRPAKTKKPQIESFMQISQQH